MSKDETEERMKRARQNFLEETRDINPSSFSDYDRQDLEDVRRYNRRRRLRSKRRPL